MDLYAYLHTIASQLDRLDNRKAILEVLDELERIQDMLDPALQEPVEKLLTRLGQKLNELD